MITTEATVAIALLLPGLLAAKIYSSVKYRPLSSNFHYVIDAMLFEVPVLGLYAMICQRWPEVAFRYTLEKSGTVVPIAAIADNIMPALVLLGLAVASGLALGVISNRDLAFAALRYLRLTKQSSMSSVWTSAFYHCTRHVLIHLKDGRRIVGWPEHFSDTQQEGMLFLTQAAYLDDEGSRTDIQGPGLLVCSLSEITMVEFLDMEDADGNGKESTQGR